jgi:subtilisin-like proprotein convertase family protein
LGGTGADAASGIAIDGAGNALVAGGTTSTDFTGANNLYEGGTKNAFILKFAPPAWAYSTYSTTSGAWINDQKTTTSTIAVAASNPIVDVNVSVTFSDNSNSDLSLALVAPDGTKVPLVNAGTLSNSGLEYTLSFDDQALSAITTGAAPYTGSFRPISPLATLIGKSTGGKWQLQVTDNVKNHSIGQFVSWGLNILYQTGQTKAAAMVPSATSGSSTTTRDAALASFQPLAQSQSDWLKDKRSPTAVDLALLELTQ